jgi:hypothetical protein
MKKRFAGLLALVCLLASACNLQHYFEDGPDSFCGGPPSPACPQ